MKIKRIFFISMVFLSMLFSCSDDYSSEDTLTPEQEALIGRRVSFQTSIADPFTTRVTSAHDGSFNENDIMVIYRQYYDNQKKAFDWQGEQFRTYYYKYKRMEGTGISLGSDWLVAGENSGYLQRKKGDYSAVSGTTTERTLTVANQTDADSLAWENGKTLRFRAWSRSNYGNMFSNKSKSAYYPDFCIAEWVNVSGPTNSIPLTLNHAGGRISFSPMSGNSIQKVELCTETADYERLDNADTGENDNKDKGYPKTFTINGKEVIINSAEEAANNVKAVYNRMCMPGGVNIELGSLKAMTKEAYEKTTDFSHIEEWEYSQNTQQNLVPFNDKDADYIRDKVQRPVFSGQNNSHCYLVTIPYDMSNDVNKSGEILVLPPYTRFRVWLYDVNGGDKTSNDKNESEYHILAIDDLKKDDGSLLYKNGLEMRAGYSYQFNVGYKYNKLSVSAGENFSWIEQDKETTGTAIENITETPAAKRYAWWKNAIKDAIPRGNEQYNPEFHITSEEQFLEFIKLVNGEAGKKGKETPIYRRVFEYEQVRDENGLLVNVPKTYKWSRTAEPAKPLWAEKEELEEEGYVFYEFYHPADGDKEAYSEETFLNYNYSFYNSALSRHFTVFLDRDLDFKDMKIDAVGILPNGSGDAGMPFMGYFDGCPERTVSLDADGNFMFSEAEDSRIVYKNIDAKNRQTHSIRNLNVNGGYLFAFVKDAAIRNLMIESYHTVGLLNTATPSMDSESITGWGCYITGISVKANNASGYNAIAKSLTGRSYVVGCIHEGDAGGALVGTASDMSMFGCMRTAANISGGALLGAYAGTDNKFLQAQYPMNNYKAKPVWGRFMCNFYNRDAREVSKDANAVGEITDNYCQLEYIRGRASRILRALNDNLLSGEASFDKLTTDQQREEYYGLAPWRAMNYAIYRWNTDSNLPGKSHPCKVHFEVETSGYTHSYPQMKSLSPETKYTSAEMEKLNVLKLKN